MPPPLANYREALDTFPLAALLVNTALMAAGVTAGQLLLSVLAAYAFTRFTFRGQRLAFVAAVGTSTPSSERRPGPS